MFLHQQLSSESSEITEYRTDYPYETAVAARVAGEDLRPGDFVTVLNTIVEMPSWLWCPTDLPGPIDEPVRSQYMPRDAGQPHKVVAICLPFVYTEPAEGTGTVTFDIRQNQLVRLSQESGQIVWKRHRKRKKKNRK